MRYLFYCIVSIIVIIFQVTLRNLISIYNIKPDFIIIFLVYLAIVDKRIPVMFFAFVLGICEDVASSQLIGLSALTNVIAAFTISSIRKKEIYHFYEPVPYLFIASLIKTGLAYSILAIGSPLEFWRAIFQLSLPTIIYTCGIGVIISTLMPENLWQKNYN